MVAGEGEEIFMEIILGLGFYIFWISGSHFLNEHLHFLKTQVTRVNDSVTGPRNNRTWRSCEQNERLEDTIYLSAGRQYIGRRNIRKRNSRSEVSRVVQ